MQSTLKLNVFKHKPIRKSVICAKVTIFKKSLLPRSGFQEHKLLESTWLLVYYVVVKCIPATLALDLFQTQLFIECSSFPIPFIPPLLALLSLLPPNAILVPVSRQPVMCTFVRLRSFYTCPVTRSINENEMLSCTQKKLVEYTYVLCYVTNLNQASIIYEMN